MVSQRDREDRCQKLWLSFSPVPHCRRQKQNNPKLSKLQQILKKSRTPSNSKRSQKWQPNDG